MHNHKQKTAVFRIIKSEINQFAVFEENYKNIDGQFNVKSSITFNFDVFSSTISCACLANCYKDDLLVVKAEVTLCYELSKETITDMTKSNEIVIPKEILVYFGSNTYSTLRGVVMAKLEPTQVRLILPLENLSKLITQSLSVEIQADKSK